MHGHFPGNQGEVKGKPWTELRRIHFLRDLDFDLVAVAECAWAGYWTGPSASQKGGTASWLIWRSERVPGHVVIMVRMPAESTVSHVRTVRAPREIQPTQPAERASSYGEPGTGLSASDEP